MSILFNLIVSCLNEYSQIIFYNFVYKTAAIIPNANVKLVFFIIE